MDLLTIRPMHGTEVDEVARLLVRCNAEHLPLFPPDIARGYLRELSDVAFRLPFSDVVLAERAGQLVGSVTYLPDAGDDGHEWPPGGAVLRLLAVDPAARRSGIGRGLTMACLERARGAGAAYLALHTAPFMSAARHLYEGLGFVRAPEHDFDPGFHYGGRTAAVVEPPWGWAYMLRFD